jgi:protein-disulfide isomerase
MRWNALALAAVCSVAIAGCGKAEDTASTKVDKEFGDKVRAYLMQHPEVIKEAIDAYNANLDAQAAEESKAAIRQNRDALERDPRDFVANPTGRYTVVEFYDYRCPHCVNVAPKVADFIARNPDVRVVFKELPIFGAPSERAAYTALAVKRAGGDYAAAYREMMQAKPLDDTVKARILARHGLTLAALDNPPEADKKHLADIHALAGKIGVTGTPSFVIGEDMAAVEKAVADLRKGG